MEDAISESKTPSEAGEEEKKGPEPVNGSKAPKINFITTNNQEGYRSLTTIVSGPKPKGLSKMDYSSGGIQSAPFLQSKNPTNTTHASNDILIDLNISGLAKASSHQKEVESIDVFNQDMELCGMRSGVFVPCMALEPLDGLELFVPGLVREEEKQEDVLSGQLKLSETCCVVSNGIQECMKLVPLSLARVSDDTHLELRTIENEELGSKHAPFLEGNTLFQRKPIGFAVHLYKCPKDSTSTVIEIQRRSGDEFVFQKFYDQSVEKLNEQMTGLRNCNAECESSAWGSLPSLDGLKLDGMSIDELNCPWDKDCLDLLANLIEDGSAEAVDMLGNLCEEMEKHVSLRTQVLQNNILMKQIVSGVLTHEDQSFVTLGLEALHISFDEEKVELIKDVLRSFQTLAFIIALLNSKSTLVLRRTVRLLSLLASKCDCCWKLNEKQKGLLSKSLPAVQHVLLENRTWSSTYATTAFVTVEMFQKITLHTLV